MSEITRNLSYHDIKLLKKNTSGKKEKIESKENLKQENQKERQD